MPTRTTLPVSAFATSVSSTFVIDGRLVTQWVGAHGVGASLLRIMSDLRDREGNYQHKMAYQTAAVSQRYPDAWTFSGTTRSTNNSFIEDFPSSAWSGKLWVRGGLAIASSSGAGGAQVGVQAAIVGNAQMFPAKTVDVAPTLNASATTYHVITGPIPALNLSEIMVACILTGVNGTLTDQPAVRFYNDPFDAGGTWTDLGTAQSPTANELRNFDGQAVSPGSTMWAQVAIKVTTAARGRIEPFVSAKYSE